MKTLIVASLPVLLATSALGCDWHTAQGGAAGSRMQMAQAQDSARPARGPQSQVSVPDQAPPATTTNTTSATDQSPKIKQMDQNAARRVETEGK
jgi:hypothetical protein